MKSVKRNSIKHIYQNIERCLLKRVHLNDKNNNEINNDNINLKNDNINLNNEIANNHEIDNNIFNRTLIAGPSFCGKTHLVLNKF